MQIRLRCYSCKNPFALKPEEVVAGLEQVEAEGHKYYNALCPRCGKANKVPKAQLKRAAPKETKQE